MWAIWVSVSSSENDGIAPMPFVTRSTTSSADGFASSRFGPTAPPASASASAWQAPQPALAKSAFPAAASPTGPAALALAVPARLGGVRLLFDLLRPRHPEHGGHLREEEHRRDEQERVEPPWEDGMPLGHEDRGDERPRDERHRDDDQHRLPERRDPREEHREDATTVVLGADPHHCPERVKVNRVCRYDT